MTEFNFHLTKTYDILIKLSSCMKDNRYKLLMSHLFQIYATYTLNVFFLICPLKVRKFKKSFASIVRTFLFLLFFNIKSLIFFYFVLPYCCVIMRQPLFLYNFLGYCYLCKINLSYVYKLSF